MKKIWCYIIFTTYSILSIIYRKWNLFYFNGAKGAFKKFPRHVALLAGIIVALLMNRGMKLEKK